MGQFAEMEIEMGARKFILAQCAKENSGRAASNMDLVSAIKMKMRHIPFNFCFQFQFAPLHRARE
jgi:hypothetical protein